MPAPLRQTRARRFFAQRNWSYAIHYGRTAAQRARAIDNETPVTEMVELVNGVDRKLRECQV